MATSAPRWHVGTSGWEYPHWKGPFYPPGMPNEEHLAFYARHFATVEVNNSFYRMPSTEALARWYETVPDDFVFAVKGSRYTTHRKYLREPVQSTERFFERIRILGDKLGPILFQLPPHWRSNPERLEAFLACMPTEFRYTFEFREPSWFNESVYDILRRYDVAFCIYEIAGRRSPIVVTTDFVYIRLHGPEQSAYTGSYSDQRLDETADSIRHWLAEGRSVYCYFDNDQAGYAAGDAMRLAERLKECASVRPAGIRRAL